MNPFLEADKKVTDFETDFDKEFLKLTDLTKPFVSIVFFYYSDFFYLFVVFIKKWSCVLKDAMPVSFRSELFTSYILTIFKQWNLRP